MYQLLCQTPAITLKPIKTFKIHVMRMQRCRSERQHTHQYSAYLFALGIDAGHSFCWSSGTGRASEIPFINRRKGFYGFKAWRLCELILIILEALFIKFLNIWKNWGCIVKYMWFISHQQNYNPYKCSQNQSQN